MNPKTNLQIATETANNISLISWQGGNEPAGYKKRKSIGIISAAIDEATVVQNIEIKRLNRCRDAHHEEIERLKGGYKNFEENIRLFNDNCGGYTSDYMKGWNDALESLQKSIKEKT